MNGFSSSAGPLDEDHQITYPFKSFDGGVTIDKQQSGERTFDINEDGIAHYGLFPDWIEGLRQYGGDAIVNDLANGAEAYLQMWERAEGVPGPRCRSRSGDMRRTGVRHVEPGLRANKLLRRAGQPQRRDGRVWRWCLNKRALDKVAITAVLTRHGRSALVATQARGAARRQDRGRRQAQARGAPCRPGRARPVDGARGRRHHIRVRRPPAAGCASRRPRPARRRRACAATCGLGACGETPADRSGCGRAGGRARGRGEAARGEDPAHEVRRAAHHGARTSRASPPASRTRSRRTTSARSPTST